MPEVVEHEDWGGETVAGRSWERVGFLDVDMTEVATEGAVFDTCTFRDVRFNVSTHRASAFVNCTFTSCSLFEARFTDCKLVGSTFVRCTFDLLQADGGDWSFVGLAGADLRRASLSRLRMREVDLSRSRCDGATLTDLDLSAARWDGATVTRCDLRGSNLSSLDPRAVDVTGARITWEQAAVVAAAVGFDVQG